MALRAQFSAPGRKERAGLGVVPTRLADCGPLWKPPLDRADFHWRLESLHPPHPAALAVSPVAARARFGRVVVLDLHRMAGIPPGPPGQVASIADDDRFADSRGARPVAEARQLDTQHV